MHTKMYYFLLFIKHGKFEQLNTIIQLIYKNFLKKKIILQINKEKISFIANNIYTVNYFLYKSFIPEKPIQVFLYNYFKKRAGIFVDIGGYVGLHSFVTKISNNKSKVYIFEADNYKYKIIRENIINNNFKNIYLENKFITGSGAEKNPNDFIKYTNNKISINDFISKKNINNIDVLKMDIEGYELYALKNVNFKKIKILLLEFHTEVIKNDLRQNPNEIIKSLKKKYNLFYINDHNNQSNSFKILNFNKKILKKNHCMLICSNLKIEIIKKYFNNFDKITIKRL